MSKSKAPSLPATPTYFEDPLYKQGVERLSSLGNRLTGFDLTGDLAPLAATTEINPDVISGYFSSLQPYYNLLRRNTVNELAAANQLESSTTANRLGQIDTDIANTLQGQTAGLIQQALQNRINLFGTGLNTISGATGFAQSNQASRNQFNLANYENILAKYYGEQKPSTGGLMGGLTGAAGGAMAGAPFGPWGMVIGGLAGGTMGALGPSGTGGQVLTAGSRLAGSKLSPKTLTYQPGSTASNRIFNQLDTTDLAIKYPGLFGGLNYN